MWSSIEEIYPVHTSSEQSPQGASVLKEPIVVRPHDSTEYKIKLCMSSLCVDLDEYIVT